MKSKAKILESVFVIFVGLGLLLGPVTVQARHKMLSEAMVKTLVEHKLIKHDLQREDNIRVSVEDHIVTLEGTVQSVREKHRAERLARRVEDVQGVENQLVINVSDLSDQQIADGVASAIRSFVFYDIFDWIDGGVNNGVVTLKGWVREPWRKTDYQRRAEAVAGVRRVDNEIEILPTSIDDDQIRVATARLIYGHPFFVRYANRSLPPIHIVVNNGNVALKGAVANKVERQLAGNLLRSGVLAFDVVNDLTVDTKMKMRK